MVLSGEKFFVPDINVANRFIVAFRSGAGTEDISLAVVDAGLTGVQIEEMPGIDTTKRMGRLVLDGVHLSENEVLANVPQAGWLAVERLLDHAAAAVTAENHWCGRRRPRAHRQLCQATYPIWLIDWPFPGS